MKVIDLFSGIGGFSLGLEKTGRFKTTRFCEIDPYCRKVLRKHWPDIPIEEDIHEFHASSGEADVVVGGFPCQPFSQSGTRLASRDPRYLWPEMYRVIRECRPTWVIGENVIGLTRLGLDEILSDLAGADYATRVFDIPAVAVGAPHRRSRLWIVAYSDSNELRNKSGRCDGASGESTTESSDHGKTESLAYSDRQGELQSQGSISQEWQWASNRGWWKVEPSVGRVADGLSAELDFLGRIDEETSHRQATATSQERKSALDLARWRFLRAVWENRKLAKTSRRLYFRKLQDFVSGLPYSFTQGRWLLGSRLEETKKLRDLWREFYSQPFEESQDVQSRLLERIRTTKRPTALGSRQDRLKALGNAIIPEIAFRIGLGILNDSEESQNYLR